MEDVNSRACMVVKYDQLSVYLNKSALSRFIQRLKTIESSNPEDFAELHFAPTIDDGYASALLQAKPSNVLTVVDESIRDFLVKAGPTELNGEIVFAMPFDLHFMLVSEPTLDDIVKQTK